MDKYSYPNHLLKCIICGPSCSGKSVFLTKLILNIIYEFEKNYIYSPSLHRGFYQKLINCFTNYIPIHIIPNIFNEKDIDLVIDEICNDKDFEKSNTERETYETIEESARR